MNLKFKSGDKIGLGKYTIAIHLPRGRGPVAVLTVPDELRGRVRVIKRQRRDAPPQE
jgi:hypothetical protein